MVVIGLFDGIGALRVAMDLQGVSVLGYVSVEKEAHARRVVESHYPGALHYHDVATITADVVEAWSLKYSQADLVVVGAGPPCQGVLGLNSDRKGALRDARSSLFVHVTRIATLARQSFRWCQVHTLMESVSSMDAIDRDIMSDDFGGKPVHIDAGQMTWCHRPRLYWTTWELQGGEGATRVHGSQIDTWVLEAQQKLEDLIEPGWTKVDPDHSFPTFTTARPSWAPGRKPAGIRECSTHELKRWTEDWHRFPPYQYKDTHGVRNRKREIRIPSIAERELMMGFPLHYTAACWGKSERKKEGYLDARLTLIGNSWSVPVVGWLLGQLLALLGVSEGLSPQQVVDLCRPGGSDSLQGRLVRLPLRRAGEGSGSQYDLAFKLCNLVSLKGEDILLSTPSSQLVKYHRLRASVPAKLWKWTVVSGWRWRRGKEHINSLHPALWTIEKTPAASN